MPHRALVVVIVSVLSLQRQQAGAIWKRQQQQQQDGNNSRSDSRIWSGTKVTDTKEMRKNFNFLMVVALKSDSSGHNDTNPAGFRIFCSGSLIASKHVLTSCMCLFHPGTGFALFARDLMVAPAAKDSCPVLSKMFQVKDVIRHNKCRNGVELESKHYQFNIGLLILYKRPRWSLSGSMRARPICPDHEVPKEARIKFLDAQETLVAGPGRFKEDEEAFDCGLRGASLSLYNSSAARRIAAQANMAAYDTGSFLFTRPVEGVEVSEDAPADGVACYGDEGVGLITRNKVTGKRRLIGVLPTANNIQCDNPDPFEENDYLGPIEDKDVNMYISVARHREWIKLSVGDINWHRTMLNKKWCPFWNRVLRTEGGGGRNTNSNKFRLALFALTTIIFSGGKLR